MSVYNPYKGKPHRKIYEQHYGAIPREADGRSYEIHHIDGNPENNDISNLVAVTLQEHYNIHYAQGDYGACFKMAKKLKLSPQEIAEISRKTQLKRLAEGTHNWQNSEVQAKAGRRSVAITLANGTHNFIKHKEKRVANMKARVANGTHNLQGPNSSSQVIWTCECCGKAGKGQGNYTRFHGKACRYPKETI